MYVQDHNTYSETYVRQSLYSTSSTAIIQVNDTSNTVPYRNSYRNIVHYYSGVRIFYYRTVQASTVVEHHK